MLRVIVAGGRDFGNRKLPDGSPDVTWHEQCLYRMQRELVQLAFDRVGTEIVSGMAPGADTLGAQTAVKWKLPVRKFPADWETHRKLAGFLRNEEMAKYADVLVAFWDRESRGTRDMIDRALKHGLEVHVFCYDKQEVEETEEWALV